MNPPLNGKIQELFKVFESFSRQFLFSRTFQDSPVYSSTFQVCANPAHVWGLKNLLLLRWNGVELYTLCFGHSKEKFSSSNIQSEKTKRIGNKTKLTDAKVIDCIWYMSRDMRFPTMWYVGPAKPQTSLHIRAVWSEPLLVAWIFYDSSATDQTSFGVSQLKRWLHSLVWVYTCQSATLLEITYHGSYIQMGESSNLPKSWTFENHILKLAVCL